MTRATRRLKMKIIRGSISATLITSLLCGAAFAQTRRGAGAHAPARRHQVTEVNRVAAADPSHTIAIVGATLIDGRGGSPVKDSVVVVRGERIVAAGSRSSVRVPAGAEVFEARGMTLLPGLIDAHFHIDG